MVKPAPPKRENNVQVVVSPPPAAQCPICSDKGYVGFITCPCQKGKDPFRQIEQREELASVGRGGALLMR